MQPCIRVALFNVYENEVLVVKIGGFYTVINQCSKAINLTKHFGQKTYHQVFFMVISSYTAYEIIDKIFCVRCVTLYKNIYYHRNATFCFKL